MQKKVFSFRDILRETLTSSLDDEQISEGFFISFSFFLDFTWIRFTCTFGIAYTQIDRYLFLFLFADIGLISYISDLDTPIHMHHISHCTQVRFPSAELEKQRA